MNKENVTFNRAAFHMGKAVIIAAIYFLSSLLGGFFALNGSTVPLLWPQTGFALAAVLLVGYSSLPGIFLGSLITALTTGVPFLFSIVSSFANILAVSFPAYFIFQQNGFSKLFDDYRSVFSLLLFGVIIGPMISASTSIMGMYFLQLYPVESLPSIWGARWLRDALGILIFTPTLLVWLGNPFPRPKINQVIEGLGIFLAVIGLELLLFIGKIPSETIYPISFLIIPLIIWSSIRNKTHGTLLINLFTSLGFLWGIAHNHGSLFNGSVPPYTTYVYVTCTMLVTSLIISASMAKLNATQKSLSFLSTHDTLTGLYNRLFFETEFKRLEKSRQFPISIIMADIDGLKLINDNFGHRSGDQVLTNVAKLFSDVFRQEDIVSRIGGDEFVILLPATDAPIAKKVVARIKKQITDYNRKHKDLPISISLGVSTANQGESLKGHLKNADKLMYQEKEEKRK
jgi:diguanylate cyclase (GGDEF)-like protein